MEEDGEETPRTPFWVQSTANLRRVELYRRRASSLFFNSGVLIIFLLLLALLSIIFIIPSLISITSHIFKPNLVKKSWDSINLVLVLFALVFGFLSRNINNDTNKSRFDNNGGDRSRSDFSTGAPVLSPANSTPRHWYDFSEQNIGGLRRHRSSSSYPDLRELSPLWNHRVKDPWRFSDDTNLNSHRVLNYDRYYDPPPHPPSPQPRPPDPWELSPQPATWRFSDVTHLNSHPVLNYDRYYFRREQDHEIKGVVRVDTPLSPSPPSPATADPTSTTREKSIRTYHNVVADDGEKGGSLDFNKAMLPETETELPEFHDSEQRGETGIRKKGKGEKRRARSLEPRKMVPAINDPKPISPAPMSPVTEDSVKKVGQIDRKRNGANATKDFFTSFKQKKKKKRQRQRSLDNLDTHIKFQVPPPPPPPSLLNNLFTSKKEKSKETFNSAATTTTTAAATTDFNSQHLFTSEKEKRKKPSIATPQSPPPPPNPAPSRVPKPTTTTRVSPFVTEKPVKLSFFNGIDDSSSGGESPMSRIPPPPPMPPFKMPDWKFAVEGDYVKVQGTLSSGSGSPDGDGSRSPSSAVVSPVFCPSPDVDTKADSFIARFRGGLKLEKINSFNQNQGNRMSNLGPCPSRS